eukprot:COSAG05_NODE_10219_length_577_cov_1.158996_1_plen_133_part_10
MLRGIPANHPTMIALQNKRRREKEEAAKTEKQKHPLLQYIDSEDFGQDLDEKGKLRALNIASAFGSLWNKSAKTKPTEPEKPTEERITQEMLDAVSRKHQGYLTTKGRLKRPGRPRTAPSARHGGGGGGGGGG